MHVGTVVTGQLCCPGPFLYSFAIGGMWLAWGGVGCAPSAYSREHALGLGQLQVAQLRETALIPQPGLPEGVSVNARLIMPFFSHVFFMQ